MTPRISAPARAVPAAEARDERLLNRSTAGRVCAFVIDSLTEARRSGRAEAILSRRLREARYLHSAERRLAADGLYDLIRYERLLAAATETDDTVQHWLAWLLRKGLPLADSRRAGLAHAERIRDLEEFASTVTAGMSDDAALGLLGSIDATFAQPLLHDVGDPIGFVAASNQRGPVVVRANRRRCTVEELRARLHDEGIPTEPGRLAEDAVVIDGPANVIGLGSYRDGWFEIQDEGSQLIGELVEPVGTVIDFCAGAGGKALQLASRSALARIVAFDVRRSALEELVHRARRAGARVDRVLLDDRGVPPAEADQWRGRAECVLVDAPCTGSGTLRRHPDLRWRIDAASIAAMHRAQLAILDRAAAFVRPGGRLVYSTCSVLRAENDDVVAEFLDQQRGFSSCRDPLRVAPHTHDTDGFFGAVLERES